jgi:uncharacterized Fe-S radical SAM superfamily protein PflX
MHLIAVNDPSELKDCQEVLKEIIEKNDNGKYEIQRDLMLTYLPQRIVDEFLDFIQSLTKEELDFVLESIKTGELTIICDENDFNNMVINGNISVHLLI